MPTILSLTTGVVYLRGVVGGSFPISVNNLVTTPADGLVLQNTTAATVGVPIQISPNLHFIGNLWDTDGSNYSSNFRVYLSGTSTANPIESLIFQAATNGASYTSELGIRRGTGGVQLSNRGWAWTSSTTDIEAAVDTTITRPAAGVALVTTAYSASTYYLNGQPGAVTTGRTLIKKITGIADNTATAVATVTVPNANHACAIRVMILSSNGSTDAFESSRVAEGAVVVARTTGANAVAAVAALTLTQIATVAAGATHTLAYDLSAIAGAAGATNTFDIRVTIDDSGNVGSNQAVVLLELINAEATGVTIA